MPLELWDLKLNHSGQFWVLLLNGWLLVLVVLSVIVCISNILEIFSVKHEYEGTTWTDKTRLTTCDPHAKHTVVNSNSPQEVVEGKEIIFTYDVEFQVCSCTLKHLF